MPEEKSRFMTVAVWVLIVISIWTIIKTVLYFFGGTPISAPDYTQTPFVSFLTTHAKAINVALLILSLATLVGALGLLWSRHWARAVLILVLPIGVLYNVVEILTISEMLRGVSQISAENASSHISGAEDYHDQIELSVRLGFWSLIALNIGMSLIYLWIVKCLIRSR